MIVEWTVQELADRAGISARTLRHYHQLGLLTPDRIGANGYRYYGPTAVARLQRVLLLREAGLSLAAIGDVLATDADPNDEIAALEAHLTRLENEQETLGRRIASVEHTLAMLREGRQPRMDMMLEGFNDRYEAEVVERWGREVFESPISGGTPRASASSASFKRMPIGSWLAGGSFTDLASPRSATRPNGMQRPTPHGSPRSPELPGTPATRTRLAP